MSSLQKFHRRTLTSGGYVAVDTLAPTSNMGDGSGNATTGYYIGGFTGGIKLYIAPKSTEVKKTWGSQGTVRGTTFVNNGLANTNILATFGTAAHPAAYYCKNLTTGGYNTWYMPAKNEVMTIYSNKGKTPFAVANGFGNYGNVMTSSEYNGTYSWEFSRLGVAYNTAFNKSYAGNYVRAVRRSAI